MTIGRSDGQPVVNVNGETVTTTTTNENGFYEFTDLPVLPEGATYTVTVTNPEGYKPTESQQGDDRGKEFTSIGESKKIVRYGRFSFKTIIC